MKFSIITPNYNGERFLERTLKSIIRQREDGIDLEIIVVDGNSSDRSIRILEEYKKDITHLIVEEDSGPANAINKGLSLANGDVVAWLNADDLYFPGALKRVRQQFLNRQDVVLCFGRCPIIDENDQEIRKFITKFKELFFPVSSRATIQAINYLSQPAVFFSRQALFRVGRLREDMVAAWDYDFILRLWGEGRVVEVPGGPLAAFRWHDGSISGQSFYVQFKEELEIAAADAGRFALQTVIHHGVRWGIVGAYYGMATFRKLKRKISGSL